MRPLFGLAPGGVCPAPDVTIGAVRSYRPSPRRARDPDESGHLFTLTLLRAACAGASRGGMFSVALSVGSPLLGVTQRPALWSSDFPPRGVPRGDHLARSTPIIPSGITRVKAARPPRAAGRR